MKSAAPQVYFVKPVGQAGPIKVGHSTDVEKRLRELGKWSPVPLEVAATIEAPPNGGYTFSRGPRFERRFHIRYAPFRLHFEWFEAHPLILSDIEAINAGTFRSSCLPAWERTRMIAA
jgi:hypothetical protein